MLSNKASLSRLHHSLWLTLVVFTVFVFAFIVYVRSEKQIDRANDLRHLSLYLASELRQSSDDLTRMVRSYIITGELRYKQHYQEVLDIRDGNKPRPVDYQNIYWDLVLADDQRPRPFGPAVALLELMRQAEFTEAEFAKLAEAKRNSDTLTRTEFAAMQLLESATPPSEVNRERARLMLHDTAYHLAKASIMQPIAEFNQMSEQRTLLAVRAAERNASLMRWLFILFSLLLLFMLWRTYRALQATLGGSVDELHGYISRLGSGDFSSRDSFVERPKDSIFSWLMEMQARLYTADARRKQAEVELERYRQHLEDLVAVRTSELVLAKQAAETANVLKSAFIANMSHEIRTPLNAITGMAHLIRRAGATPQQVERLDKIDAAGQHLLEIINAILDLSKIEAGKFTLEETDVSVGAIMANVISMLFDRAQAKKLKLLVESEALSHHLLGDATRLQQALLNYASNAIKFTETGSVTLRSRLEAESADSVRVRFEVQDSGPGIEPENLSRLFSSFEQADNSITRKYGGTGLGLAITRKLAELMGGTAGASSTLGAGSTFWFTVVLKKGQGASLAALATSGNSAESRLLRDYRNLRVLLVEDEMINREVILEFLRDVWQSIDVAENGVAAVELAEKNRYGLILMDMQMPLMDGLEATRRIRLLDNGKRTLIVAMTANAFAEDKARCFEAGMDDFIAKPVAPELLFTTLLNCLLRQA